MLNDWLATQVGSAAIGTSADVTPNSAAPAARPNPNVTHVSGANFLGNGQQQQAAQPQMEAQNGAFGNPPAVNQPVNQPAMQSAPAQPSLNGFGNQMGAPQAQPQVAQQPQFAPQANAAPQQNAPAFKDDDLPF